MNLIVLGGSIAGVIALVLVAWLLRLGGAAIGDEAEAKRAAEDHQYGFVAEEAWVSADGRAALVRGGDGSFVLLKVHGAHVAARRLKPPLRVSRGDDGVVVATGELMFGDVRLRLAAEQRDAVITDVGPPLAPPL